MSEEQQGDLGSADRVAFYEQLLARMVESFGAPFVCLLLLFAVEERS